MNGGISISIVEQEKSIEVEQFRGEQRMESDTDEFDLISGEEFSLFVRSLDLLVEWIVRETR